MSVDVMSMLIEIPIVAGFLYATYKIHRSYRVSMAIRDRLFFQTLEARNKIHDEQNKQVIGIIESNTEHIGRLAQLLDSHLKNNQKGDSS